MILKLLRINLQSDWLPIFFTAALSFQFWIITIGKMVPGYTTSESAILGLLPFPFLFSLLGARRKIQKRDRLLAQLPVTATAIRISGWLSYFTIVAIACLIGIAILLISPPAPGWGWVGFAEGVGGTIALFTCWVALWRILGIPWSMRPLFQCIIKGIAIWLFLMLLLLGLGAGWFSGGKVPGSDGVTAQWTLFLEVTTGIAVALILVDILLDRFADNRCNSP